MSLIVVNESKLRRAPVAPKLPLIEASVGCTSMFYAYNACLHLVMQQAWVRRLLLAVTEKPPLKAAILTAPPPPLQLVLRYQDADMLPAAQQAIEGALGPCRAGMCRPVGPCRAGRKFKQGRLELRL